MESKTDSDLLSGRAAGDSVFSLDCTEHDEPRLINFYEPEFFNGRTFRWSEAVAMVRIDIDPGNYEVTLDTGSLRGTACDFPFELHWNEHSIERSTIQAADGLIRFPIGRHMFSANCDQRLTIAARALKAENGRRHLGMPLCGVQVVNTNTSTLPFPGASQNRKGKPARSGVWPFVKRRSPRPSIPIWNVKMPELSRQPIAVDEQDVPSCPCEDVVVSSVEINARHGTGLLIQYLVGDFSRTATVNSIRCYNGERVRSAVHFCLPDKDLPRHEIYHLVHRWFGKHPPKRAYVVPFFESDLYIGLALNDLFKTRISLHIMDDNCLYSSQIRAAVCAEAVEKADLVFAISPEMRQAYEQRFGRKFMMLPPIVPPDLIPDQLVQPDGETEQVPSWHTRWWQSLKSLLRRSPAASASATRGILIGNIWDRSWLELLRKTIRESNLQIDWFSNNPEAVWLKGSVSDLAKDGIHLHPALWGDALVAELRRRPFALMPSGQLSPSEARESIARLSLPSRVPFTMATSHLPIIVLGSEQTAAARFVSRFQLGAVVPYEGRALRSAVQDVLKPNAQSEIRQRSLSLAKKFSAEGVGQWMWESLDRGDLVDQRFEEIFAPMPGEFQWYFDAQPPRNINWSFRSTWQMLHRLRGQGVAPEVIIDVGASTGIWSWTAAQVFPKARYILVDPMMSQYDPTHRQHYQQQLPSCEIVEAALSDRAGEAEILVSDDLYGSSLLKVDTALRNARTRRVPLQTLDDVARQLKLHSPALLKIDVQFAEHLVLMGGRQFVQDHVVALIMELTLEREHPQAKTYREMLDLADELGFALVDETEGWRNPRTGRLEQKDSVFLRRDAMARSRAA